MSKVNPKYKFKLQAELNKESFISGLNDSDITVLGKALTLAESTLPKDQYLINQILLETQGVKKSRRIAVTGPPGAGKSTFINATVLQVQENDHKTAIIATDPTSEYSKGSILGDKTRMDQLVGNNKVFIRPIASGSELGGVAASTKKAIMLCEAGGFDTIFIETVGVGQSAFEVSKLVDLFILVLSPAAGDELQGIKRGIVEMADIIIVNKNDGDLAAQAKLTQDSYLKALHLLPKKGNRNIPVLLVSSAEQSGLDLVQSEMDGYFNDLENQKNIEHKRIEQNEYWFKKEMTNMLLEHIRNKYSDQLQIDEFISAIQKSEMHYLEAVEQIRKSLNE